MSRIFAFKGQIFPVLSPIDQALLGEEKKSPFNAQLLGPQSLFFL